MGFDLLTYSDNYTSYIELGEIVSVTGPKYIAQVGTGSLGRGGGQDLGHMNA